jgi:hypothetical protein
MVFGCSDAGWTPGRVEHFAVRITRVQTLDQTGAWVDHDLSQLPAAPLSYGERTKLSVDIEAVPGDRGFNAFVQVKMVPGEVVGITSANADVLRTNILVRAGTITTAEVEVEGSYGEARLWIEDVGLDPAPLEGAACDDGLDNDGDGLYDYPGDPGCYLRNDGSEQSGTHAVGVSDAVMYRNPRLANANGCDLVPDLERQSVHIDSGDLWVTAVTANGFYVSDLAFMGGACDPASGCCDGGRYSHIYAYNFNTPYNLRVCDRLDSLTGIVGDFYGFTELNFPSWELADIDPVTPGAQYLRIAPSQITDTQCPLEQVMREITPEMLRSRRTMETYESALVFIRDAMLPLHWVECDLNGNGTVGYSAATEERVEAVSITDPYVIDDSVVCSGGWCSEWQCNKKCTSDSEGCAELSTYREYGQYPVRIEGAPILVVTAGNVPGFNPRDRVEAGQRSITELMGMLREFEPLDSPWIIEPRCRQDIIIEGDPDFRPVDVRMRCVPSEETGDYEDPY